MVKQIFCWLYSQWLAKAVDSKSDPLVSLLDAIAGSNCKYCMAVRTGMIGFGLAVVLRFDWWGWVGGALIWLAILMTLGERYWLCDIKDKK
jgi:hypothetical protein